MSKWYVKKNADSDAVGPLDSAALRSMAASGFVSTENLVSNDGVNWHPATAIKGLKFNEPELVLDLSRPAPPLVRPVAPPEPAPGTLEYEARIASRTHRPTMLHYRPDKPNRSIAVLLALFFGWLGLIYSSWRGAVVMLILTLMVSVFLAFVFMNDPYGVPAIVILTGVFSSIFSTFWAFGACSDAKFFMGNHHYD